MIGSYHYYTGKYASLEEAVENHKKQVDDSNRLLSEDKIRFLLLSSVEIEIVSNNGEKYYFLEETDVVELKCLLKESLEFCYNKTAASARSRYRLDRMRAQNFLRSHNLTSIDN